MYIVKHQGLKIVFAALICLQIAACGGLIGTNAQISPSELITQIQAGNAPLILDVRTTKEYQEGHIPGAINIPFREIGDRLDEISVSKDATIIVYCERGIRAGVAEKTLRAAGFTSVLGLQGDISAWRENSLPIE